MVNDALTLCLWRQIYWYHKTQNVAITESTTQYCVVCTVSTMGSRTGGLWNESISNTWWIYDRIRWTCIKNLFMTYQWEQISDPISALNGIYFLFRQRQHYRHFLIYIYILSTKKFIRIATRQVKTKESFWDTTIMILLEVKLFVS